MEQPIENKDLRCGITGTYRLPLGVCSGIRIVILLSLIGPVSALWMQVC